MKTKHKDNFTMLMIFPKRDCGKNVEGETAQGADGVGVALCRVIDL
jgi:hypothetical protein